METLYLLLAAYGISFGILHDKLRVNGLFTRLPGCGLFFTEFFSCVYCTSFQAGLFIYILRLGDVPQGLVFPFIAAAFGVLVSPIEEILWSLRDKVMNLPPNDQEVRPTEAQHT